MNNPVGLLSKLTEALANLSIQAVLIAIGAMMAILALTRTFGRNREPTTVWIIENVQIILSVVVVVFLVIRPYLFQAFYIPSGSMEPTLMGPDTSKGRVIGDRLLVNKLLYRTSDPHRGDIVVFRAPKEANSEEKEFIKRVVGLPGETVCPVPQRVLVDGRVALGPGADFGNGVSFDEVRKPPVEVKGSDATIHLSYQQATMQLLARPSPRVEFDPHQVTVDGRTVLSDPEGRIQAVPIANYGADKGVEGTVYTIGGDVRLAVVTGRSITYSPSHIAINGQPLAEPYLDRPESEIPRYAADSTPIKLADNQYFMMGDNRNNSNDSRVWGPLTRDRVIGRAELLFWPLNRFQIMHYWLILVLAGILVGYQILQKYFGGR